MPLSVWKKLGLPDLIPTQMTLELANRTICTPDEIARDVFVPVGNFTFPADFVVVDYESDPRVPLILRRPFLRTARALIDVHGKEMILRDGDESEDCLKDLDSHKQSGNPTFLLHKEIDSPEVIPEIHDSKGCSFLSEELPDIYSFNEFHSYFDDDPLSGSTTYSANSLLEEFADELALISYPPDYDDNRTCDIDYSNQPQKESINLINVFNNSSKDFLEDLFSTNQPSGNPTFSSHLDLTSLEVNYDTFDLEGGNVLPEKLLDLDSTKDLHPPLHVNPLSGSTTYFSSNPLLKEFADELAFITFPSEYGDYL
nr:reverse transcriptase domain-containing protein [Tanacetum cinerariifolium]